MRRPTQRHTLLAAVLTVAVGLGGVAAGSAQASGGGAGDTFTTKTPYRPQESRRSYAPAPDGYHAVFTENVSRHGARTLTDSDDGDAVLALWRTARAEHGLTSRGRGLGPEVRRLLAANAAVGYGLLTGSGKAQLEATGQRMEQRLPGLFHQAALRPGATPRIEVFSSSKQRAMDSAYAFEKGLVAARPGVYDTLAPLETDDDLLYFHKAAINQDYQDYLADDPRLKAVEAQVRAEPATTSAARAILDRSFTAAFVKRVEAGDFPDQFTDATAAAEALYSLDSVTKDMPQEGRWRFDQYLTPSSTAWFGYLDDVTSFYENGPGFQGDDITYRMAEVLLDDMFARLDARRDGSSDDVAVLRFSHAEEILPLAALLGLPGSTQQASEQTPYTYANNSFRGARVAPMAANIQWDLFESNGRYLVRMLYNEKQTAFKAGCTPIHRGSYFYSLDALEKCYGRS